LPVPSMYVRTASLFIPHGLDPTTSESCPTMLWTTLRAWFPNGTPSSESARQIAIPRVDNNPGKELAAKGEYDATALQTPSRRRAFSRQTIPPQQSNIREFSAVVLGGWLHHNF